MLNYQPTIMVQIMTALLEEEGLDVDMLERWLYKKIWWARVEVSGLVKVFHQGSRMLVGDGRIGV